MDYSTFVDYKVRFKWTFVILIQSSATEIGNIIPFKNSRVFFACDLKLHITKDC